MFKSLNKAHVRYQWEPLLFVKVTYWRYDRRCRDKSSEVRTISSILTTILAHEYQFSAKVSPSGVDGVGGYFQPPFFQLQTSFRAIPYVLTKFPNCHYSLFRSYPGMSGQILQEDMTECIAY